MCLLSKKGGGCSPIEWRSGHSFINESRLESSPRGHQNQTHGSQAIDFQGIPFRLIQPRNRARGFSAILGFFGHPWRDPATARCGRTGSCDEAQSDFDVVWQPFDVLRPIRIDRPNHRKVNHRMRHGVFFRDSPAAKPFRRSPNGPGVIACCRLLLCFGRLVLHLHGAGIVVSIDRTTPEWFDHS